ncbi:Nitrate/nitrite response regulator protein NarL [Corynebacterium auriscanis]|nr:Nitrate/nitrite response regulator protein NarL [Corynebacterium auriscanis]
MPRMNGVEFLDKLKELEQPPIFIAMTAFDTDDTMLQVLAHGGAGYVIKSDKPRSIIDAADDACNGGTALSPQCVTRLMKLSIILFNSATNKAMTLGSSQKNVLELLCAGCSNAEIAKPCSAHRLSLPRSTLGGHVVSSATARSPRYANTPAPHIKEMPGLSVLKCSIERPAGSSHSG